MTKSLLKVGLMAKAIYTSAPTVQICNIEVLQVTAISLIIMKLKTLTDQMHMRI